MKPAEREQLVSEYVESLATVRRAKRKARARATERARVDAQILSGMERDLIWILNYLESGHPPDFRRGAFRWIVPVDPHKLGCMIKARRRDGDTSEWRSFDPDLEDLLAVLTPREREALVLVRGHNCSYREAARYMQVSDGTVSTLVRRAERKIRRASLRQFVAHPSQ